MNTTTACGCEGVNPRGQLENRGITWIVGAFLICPCHLPLTLWLIGALRSGTAIAPFVLGYSVLIGILITAAWLGATAYGFHQLRAGRRLADESSRISGESS